MPLYEYECQECQKTFEKLVRNSDPVECPHCRSQRLQRLLSVPAKPPASQSLPMSCNSSGPPCGPSCSRW
jgi:putative FmdB family regulatory protein